MPVDDNARLAVLENMMKGLAKSTEILHDDVKQVGRKVDHVEFRINELEKKVEAMTPSISDFNTLKNQASGAARFAQFTWFIGAALIAIALWFINHSVTIS